MIVFRHADPRFPFLWEGGSQPAGRWNAEGRLTHYFSDTPDGAWAEFLRHEEIVDPEDLPTIRRALWAVEIGDAPTSRPSLPMETLTGGRDSWPDCQSWAETHRTSGVKGMAAPSAALVTGGARGWRVDGGPRPGPERDGTVFALFGPRPDLVGWAAAVEGCPGEDLLGRVRHYLTARRRRLFPADRPGAHPFRGRGAETTDRRSGRLRRSRLEARPR